MGLKENLRRKRLAHQMTLEQVGKAIGVSRQTILRYETGVIANPPAEKIEGLAALYHTTPARLMGWEGRFTAAAGRMKTARRIWSCLPRSVRRMRRSRACLPSGTGWMKNSAVP